MRRGWIGGARRAEAAEQAGRRRGGWIRVAGVMVQAVWLDAAPEVAGRLVVVIHHLVVDGVSWRVLVPGPGRGVDRRWRPGGRPVLEPVPTSFRGWALLLAAAAGQVDGGGAGLVAAVLDGGDPLVGSRALDPADTAGTMRRVAVPVPGDRRRCCGQVPAVFQGGVNDVLLAGLAVAVMRVAGRRRCGGGAGRCGGSWPGAR